MTGFQDLCSALLPAEKYNTIDWDLYDYDKVRAEFIKNTDNPVSNLVETIKSEVEMLIEKYRSERRKVDRLVEDKDREIREIEANADKVFLFFQSFRENYKFCNLLSSINLKIIGKS